MSNTYRPFRSVLIANRGEIAQRVIREARSRGFRSIAVYSEADRDGYHVWLADEAVCIGPAPAKDSYLRAEAILAAAKASGTEAVHPGYGFLAENADFAQAVIDAGLVWIGPTPEAIRTMGNKGEAKLIAHKADVPVIAGYHGQEQADDRLAKEAARIGWPVMIKAANGGGGRGMRRVERQADFPGALASARRESLSAFGSADMLLEMALDHVRHVEVQVFGDAQGNVIHLGERDCSAQRRNQKTIEEAPCPVVTPGLRERMGAAAVRLAKAVGYVNAGTVEFLLDEKLDFYFLEMNTRIQVEHPVTEEITGLNLIQWQFDVAQGRPLPIGQQDVRLDGHAIEARLCAEDPAAGFRPETGVIERFFHQRDVRVDGRWRPGSRVPGHYDSMLAKFIARGASREEARRKLIAGLRKAHVSGVRTNRDYLVSLLEEEAFVRGEIDIGWLGRLTPYTQDNLEGELGLVAALVLAQGEGVGWRSTGLTRVIVMLRERERAKTFVVEDGAIGALAIERLERSSPARGIAMIRDGNRLRHAKLGFQGPHLHVHFGGRDAIFEDVTYAGAEPKGGASDAVLRAPMDGKIVAVRAEAGALAKKGQVLVVLEAMKMEHEIVAAADGVVEAVSVKAGDQVSTRQVLVTLAPAA